MIVSHKHRFIFMKTRKTAGTSVELALSPFCGPQDILTPIGRDERLRAEGTGARNTVIDRKALPPLVRARLRLGAKPEAVGAVFVNHTKARAARRVLGRKIWRTYFTFSIERNPWDRQVSFYYWQYRNPEKRPAFETYLRDPHYRACIDNFGIYGIRDEVIVDQVLRYENLAEDFAAVLQRLGLPADTSLPRVKAAPRPKGAHYSSLYTPETRDLVASWYRREIEAFGYTFDDREMQSGS